MDEMEMMREWLSERFDSLGDQVAETQRLQRETNGRLRGAEGHIADMSPRVRTLEREMGEVRKGENRRITLWDVYLVIGGMVAAVGVLKLIGLLK